MLSKPIPQLTQELIDLQIAAHEFGWYQLTGQENCGKLPTSDSDISLLHRCKTSSEIMAVNVDVDQLKSLPITVHTARLLCNYEGVNLNLTDERIAEDWGPCGVSTTIQGQHDCQGLRSGHEIRTSPWDLPTERHTIPMWVAEVRLTSSFRLTFHVSNPGAHHFVVRMDESNIPHIPDNNNLTMRDLIVIADDIIVTLFPEYKGCPETRIHISMPFSVAQSHEWHLEREDDNLDSLTYTAVYLGRRGYGPYGRSPLVINGEMVWV